MKIIINVLFSYLAKQLYIVTKIIILKILNYTKMNMKVDEIFLSSCLKLQKIIT